MRFFLPSLFLRAVAALSALPVASVAAAPPNWPARFITADCDQPAAEVRPATLFRHEFPLEKKVASAQLFASSLGLYSIWINGRAVSTDALTPGWTSYAKRLQYQTYDVTSLLTLGDNAIAGAVADGWFRGHVGFMGLRNAYGEHTALWAQVIIRFEDGTQTIVGTDETWRSSTGPILGADLFAGETYDARLEQKHWDSPGFDDSAWKKVSRVDWPLTTLVPALAPPVRRIEEILPVAATHPAPNSILLDFGQNLTGRVRLKVRAAAGTTLTLHHGEVLNSDGTLYTQNLRGADQIVTYICKGEGEETYEPTFTFQGFRYVDLAGYPGTPPPNAFTAIVIHSDLAATGAWECSDVNLNKLWQNIRWSQRGNFVDVPTDCPQRDERSGWTGDAAAFVRTGTYNFDCRTFFTKWLADLAADQEPSGSVPWVIPDIVRNHGTSAGWGDAAVIVPWAVYQAYNDRTLLESQYPSMKRWVDFAAAQAPDGIWDNTPFGDWLATVPTEKNLICTAYLAHSTDLLSRAAGILDKNDDAKIYAELFEKIRAAFNQAFVSWDAKVGNGTQTAYALALRFDLLPSEQRQPAADRLADDVKAHDNHLTTGFLGTPHLCPVLAQFNHLDTAYALLNQTTFPSWLYPVLHGATTVWERWDGVKPEGAFQDPTMNSFNHYAYGAIGEWLYTTVAGIETDPEHPGYDRILIHPQPGGGLTWLRSSVRTPHGNVACAWKIEGQRMTVALEIPGGTEAVVTLPGSTVGSVKEQGTDLGKLSSASEVRQTAAGTTFILQPGNYSFEYPRLR